MLDRLIQELVASPNQAADDLLLEALHLGNTQEKTVALGALLRRQTVHGLSGVIDHFEQLPENLQLLVLENIRAMHHALRECGRSDDTTRRLAAIRLIALGRQGKLCYVLSENLHEADEGIAKHAVDAIVALARWVASQTRALQKGTASAEPATARACRDLLDNRPEIEQVVVRSLEVHRGKFSQELVRAALLLCDSSASQILPVIASSRYGSQSLLQRRLQEPPTAEHVDSFLVACSRGGLRPLFAPGFSHISEAPAFEALLRKTHWLKDNQLRLCMVQVQQGAWLDEAQLPRELARRSPGDIARIGEWVGASGLHDVLQDERMLRLNERLGDEPAERLRLLRVAMSRPVGASIQLLRRFLTDPDERFMRLAAREIVRRHPREIESILLPLMTSAPDSVRRIIGRAISKAGFDHYWMRFDRLDKPTRRRAGQAMLKILPDASQRLSRRLLGGPMEQRIKGLTMAQELGLAEPLREILVQLCGDAHPRIRSKAVQVLGELPVFPSQLLLDRVLNDADARVRANAVEVLEAKRRTEYVPLLTERARSATNRERANAIKAMHRMRVSTAATQLNEMLRDDRAEHRISAMWALKQIGFWRMLNEVARLSRADENLRVRRYAQAVLRDVAGELGLDTANRSA